MGKEIRECGRYGKGWCRKTFVPRVGGLRNRAGERTGIEGYGKIRNLIYRPSFDDIVDFWLSMIEKLALCVLAKW